MSAQQHSTINQEIERLTDESKALSSQLNNEIPIDEYLVISDELLQVNRQISAMMNEAVHAPVTVEKRKPRKPKTVHIIVNKDDVNSGVDHYYRGLCGHVFPARYGIPSSTASGVDRAGWVQCQPCQDMAVQAVDLKRSQQREQKALRLAQFLLDRMDERGIDF